MGDPLAWAVVGPRGVSSAFVLEAVANDWASHHGGRVVPLVAGGRGKFIPEDESLGELLGRIGAFIEQTDPWINQVRDRHYKVDSPEQKNARKALKEVCRRLRPLTEPPKAG